MKRAKKFLCLFFATIMLVSLVACGDAPAEEESDSQGEQTAEVVRTPQYIKLAGGPSGSTGYASLTAMADLVNMEYPDYVFAPDITSGSAENARMMAAGDMQMGLVMADVSVSAYTATREFEGEEALKESINYVMAGFVSSFNMFVPADSDITSLADLEGKKVGVSKGTMQQYYWPMLLEAYGLDESKIEVSVLSLNDICVGVQDGILDFGVHVTPAPSGVISDIALSKGIRLLGFEPDKIEWISTNYPFFQECVIPAGTYPGVDTDTITMGTQNTLCCRPDLDEQFVYDFCDVVFANQEALDTVSENTAGQFSLKNVLLGQTIPIHPGAERWYRENGYLD